MSWVILSEEMGTAELSRYTETLPDSTVVIVGGPGDAAARVLTTVGDTSLTGAMRREVFVDAKYATTADLRTTAGEKELASNTPTVLEMRYIETPGCIFGDDFDVGDTVTVDTGIYGVYDMEVVSAEINYTSQARNIIIILGGESTNIVRMIRDITRDNPGLRS